MEKYFLPEISDIRIGYECEINHSRGYSNEYTPTIIGYKDNEFAYTHEISDIIHMIDDGYGEVRTKYLTKEDIEKEGWKLSSNPIYFGPKPDFRHHFTKDNWMIIFDERKPHLEILAKDLIKLDWLEPFYEKFRIIIPCPCINKFRDIIKLINL